MKYDMIVSDFDGTLFTDDFKVTDYTIETISKYIAAGGKMFIATGRLFQAILPYVKLLRLENEVIAYQGSGIFDIKSGKTLYKQDIDTSLAVEIYDRMYSDYNGKCIPLMYYDDNCYVEDENEYVLVYSKIVNVPLKITKMPLNKYVSDNNIRPSKVLSLVIPTMVREFIEDMRTHFGDLFNINQSSKGLVELVNKKASKGNAVAWLAEKYNIPREKIMCIGDAENDNSMLEYAGLGVAMGNAMDVTKAVADYITDTNDNDGVAKAIEKFCLNKE